MENNNETLYDIFVNYSYSQLKNLFKNAKTEDEKKFWTCPPLAYMTLSNIVLQKEQQKVIGK
ncbi:hypothetical protein KPL39_17540 [Clostridium gasigenes]|uniref:hypothetical protein n=1 Tax=Clostridium gasigenes TaxID=94869 RepID=UPI001C0D223D|nr:hypothetical protein [Clostridium gasigenes]MBU3138037.1 hypothetical protein [Clostridium gasigenes]